MAAVDSKNDTSKMHLPPAFHISGQSMVELPADKSIGNTASVRPAIVFENNENNEGDGVKSSYKTNVSITRIENHLPEQMKSSDDLFSDFEKADRAVCDVVSRIAREAIDHPFKAASEAVLGVAAGAISAEIIGAVAGAVVSVSAAEMIGSVAGTVIGAMYTGTQLQRDATFHSAADSCFKYGIWASGNSSNSDQIREYVSKY
jgi:hypothetical protein